MTDTSARKSQLDILEEIKDAVANAGELAKPDRELAISTYVVKTAFTGASLGDTVTAVQVIDVSGTPTTVSVIWRNQSTATDLAGAPSAANLELLGSQAWTDAQARAQPIPVALDLGSKVTVITALGAGGSSLIGWLSQIWDKLSGTLTVSAMQNGAWVVDGSTVTQPVSAASLPLPSDASTSALQTTGNTALVDIAAKLVSGPSTGATSQSVTPASDAVFTVTVGQITTVTVTITNGGNLSAAVDLGLMRLGRIVMPADWTAAEITFETSHDGVTYKPYYSDDDTEYSIAPPVGVEREMPLSKWLGVRYLKVRSGTVAAPINQAAARDLILVLVP